MSDNPLTAAQSDQAAHQENTVSNWVHWAFAGLEHFAATVGNNWAAVKQSPEYALLAPMAEKAVLSELTAMGIPPQGATDIGMAIGAGLDRLAALHPDITTH